MDASYLRNVWGSSRDNIFAVGYNGTILHYNGINWQKQESNSDAQLLSVWGIDGNDVYVVGAKLDNFEPNDTTIYYLYHYNGQSWITINSYISTPLFTPGPFGTVSLWGTKKSNLYSVGLGIYQIIGSNWIKLVSTHAYLKHIYGNNDKNIFAVGQSGLIYHYNGENWKELTLNEFTGIAFEGVWTDGNQVFIVGSDGRDGYILHGK